MLDLDYAPEVPLSMIDLVEHHGRGLGLPLATLELIGQSLDAAERFILAVESGHGLEFAEALDVVPLEALLRARHMPVLDAVQHGEFGASLVE